TAASTFGDEGEWSERVGFDSVAQAMCGVAYLSGEEAPSRSQASWVDFGTAVHCAYGTVLALMERDKTGRGQKVSGNLLSTAMMMMTPQHLEQDLVAANRPPLGNHAASGAPIGTFKVRDGWISCHVVGQPIFERLVEVIGRRDWLEDPRFASDTLRGDNREHIIAFMNEWCAERTRDEVLEAFAEKRIPVGPVLSLQEAIDHPQTAALGLHEPVEYPGLGKPAKIARAPVWLSDHDGDLRPPPMLGADTKEVLGSLGFGAEEIAKFKSQNVI
ncbi:MAG: CoA transferase, partial [Pseudomonadota bacterium]